jgi:hypothetical protein
MLPSMRVFPCGTALNAALTRLSLADIERIEILPEPAPVRQGFQDSRT